MTIMKRILVALDGSQNSFRGLAKAIEIAKQDQSKIIGLNILELPQSYFVTRPKTQMKAVLAKTSKNILEDAKRKCTKAGVDYESKIIPGGDIGYDIVNYSKKHKIHTIVIGARGLNPLKEMVLGSVSNYVMHKSKIPVLVVK